MNPNSAAEKEAQPKKHYYILPYYSQSVVAQILLDRPLPLPVVRPPAPLVQQFLQLPERNEPQGGGGGGGGSIRAIIPAALVDARWKGLPHSAADDKPLPELGRILSQKHEFLRNEALGPQGFVFRNYHLIEEIVDAKPDRSRPPFTDGSRLSKRATQLGGLFSPSLKAEDRFHPRNLLLLPVNKKWRHPFLATHRLLQPRKKSLLFPFLHPFGYRYQLAQVKGFQFRPELAPGEICKGSLKGRPPWCPITSLINRRQGWPIYVLLACLGYHIMVYIQTWRPPKDLLAPLQWVFGREKL